MRRHPGVLCSLVLANEGKPLEDCWLEVCRSRQWEREGVVQCEEIMLFQVWSSLPVPTSLLPTRGCVGDTHLIVCCLSVWLCRPRRIPALLFMHKCFFFNLWKRSSGSTRHSDNKQLNVAQKKTPRKPDFAAWRWGLLSRWVQLSAPSEPFLPALRQTN